MPTPHQRRRYWLNGPERDGIPLDEWARIEYRNLPVSRGQLMSVLTAYDRDRAWYRRLWRYLTSAAGE